MNICDIFFKTEILSKEIENINKNPGGRTIEIMQFEQKEYNLENNAKIGIQGSVGLLQRI